MCLHVQISGDGNYQNQRLPFESRKASAHSLLISTLSPLTNALERDPVFCLPSPFRIKQFGMEQQNQGRRWAGSWSRSISPQTRATVFIPQHSLGHYKELGISVCDFTLSWLRVFANASLCFHIYFVLVSAIMCLPCRNNYLCSCVHAAGCILASAIL